MLVAAVSHPVLLVLVSNRLGSDVNQHTGRVNPGEIEIHLQSRDRNQATPIRLYRASEGHGGCGTSAGGEGDSRRAGERRRLHLGPRGGFRKERAGL